LLILLAAYAVSAVPPTGASVVAAFGAVFVACSIVFGVHRLRRPRRAGSSG
jgi:hypothetical protein